MTGSPSTATIVSPGSILPSAGEPGSISPTWAVGSTTEKARKKKIANAISRFTAGPAAITTIRFQTGWW